MPNCYCTTPHGQATFRKLLGEGSMVGHNLQYEIQDEPKGLAEAFTKGIDFIGKDKFELVWAILIFGNGICKLLQGKNDIKGASIFAYPVPLQKCLNLALSVSIQTTSNPLQSVKTHGTCKKII